ncbi:hypothetical protein ABT120_29635 [Nonomuraea angiospora]|uniref:hypothetical protein n=1 Tax=Nonomuraea angiospora TaxID=46172 RepID=UPI003318F4E5
MRGIRDSRAVLRGGGARGEGGRGRGELTRACLRVADLRDPLPFPDDYRILARTPSFLFFVLNAG